MVDYSEHIFHFSGRPYPPTLTSLFCENGIANLTWSSSFNGGSTQVFKVQYKENGGDWVALPDAITDPGENMTVGVVVEALEEGRQYSFRVYSENRLNKSDTAETSCTLAGN